LKVEVVEKLFTLRLDNKKRVTLLRGNHEDTQINGWEMIQNNLLGACQRKFGDSGVSVFEHINDVFLLLPIAAVINNQVLCVHGGLCP